MNEVARRYWSEILDLRAPVLDEPRRDVRRVRRLRLRKVRSAPPARRR